MQCAKMITSDGNGAAVLSSVGRILSKFRGGGMRQDHVYQNFSSHKFTNTYICSDVENFDLIY